MARLFKEFSEEKWAQVRTHEYFRFVREDAVSRADRYCETEPPVLKFSKLHDYLISGNRENYERDYEAYFDRLETLTAAYMITSDDKYLTPLADILWNICDMESWSIPAHVGEQLSIAERRQNLDLCSTIAGMKLGEVIHFLGDKLPELVVKRVKAEIRYRVIDSYRDAPKNRYWWERCDSNWASVCIAAVLSSYVYVASREETMAQLPRMLKTIEGYLSGFDDEGCCLEGYAYWNYGFSYFCIFASVLNEFTDGEINLFDSPKVYNIAKFQERIPLNERECVSFSDAVIEFRPLAWLSHFLKGIYPDLAIPAIPPSRYAGEQLRVILWQNPELADSSLDLSKPVSFTYSIAQWFIYRSQRYSFACKAGYNNESHNHNDIGSFIISKNEGVNFCDPGVGEYTRQYFSYPERYDILVCSSRGHSVPIINGSYQVLSKKKATVIANSERRYCFTMQDAYSIPTLNNLYRDFICDDFGVTLIDTYSFSEKPESVVERFVSLKPIEVHPTKIVSGDSVVTTHDFSIFEISTGSEIIDRKQGKKETLYYVDLKVRNPECDMGFVFNFR